MLLMAKKPFGVKASTVSAWTRTLSPAGGRIGGIWNVTENWPSGPTWARGFGGP